MTQLYAVRKHRKMYLAICNGGICWFNKRFKKYMGWHWKFTKEIAIELKNKYGGKVVKI